MDAALLKDSFAAAEPHADEMIRWFYGHLFASGGERVAALFPPDQAYVRKHLAAALAAVVDLAGDRGKLAPVLARLGADHRKHGIGPAEFDLAGKSLIAALARHDPAWTPARAQAWTQAWTQISGVMLDAIAAADRAGVPPWYGAEITAARGHGCDVTVLTARIDGDLSWEPGQSLSVRLDDGPPVWRPLTPANPPRPDRTAGFHVKTVPGGALSPRLALHARPGTRLRLAPHTSALRLDEDSPRDIAMIAGSTGLAPMLAMITRLAERPCPPQVRLFFGAATPAGLYDLDRLAGLAGDAGWLTLTHCAAAVPPEDAGYDGQVGSVVDVAAATPAHWPGLDVYICGPAAMTAAAARRTAALGTPPGQIKTENFGWEDQ